MNNSINQKLHSLAESDYKRFNERIISTGYETLGVRLPALRKLAKELVASPGLQTYLDNAEYTTYEHILLYGLVLGQLKKPSIEMIFRYVDPLILKFDNWAHVDTIISSLKVFGKHPGEVSAHFLPLKTHEGEFAKRTFVIILMDFFMDETCIDSTLKHLAEVPQGQYYVDMAIAWALSLGLVRFPAKTLPLLEQRVFSRFVHNKAIQKARESYRVPQEMKERLNGIVIKNNPTP